MREARLPGRLVLAAAAGAAAFHATVARTVPRHDAAAGAAAWGVAHVVEVFHGGGGVVEAAVGGGEDAWTCALGGEAGVGGEVGGDSLLGGRAVVALEGFA